MNRVSFALVMSLLTVVMLMGASLPAAAEPLVEPSAMQLFEPSSEPQECELCVTCLSEVIDDSEMDLTIPSLSTAGLGSASLAAFNALAGTTVPRTGYRYAGHGNNKSAFTFQTNGQATWTVSISQTGAARNKSCFTVTVYDGAQRVAGGGPATATLAKPLRFQFRPQPGVTYEIEVTDPLGTNWEVSLFTANR